MKDKPQIKEVNAKWIIKLPEDGEVEVKFAKNHSVKQGEILAEVKHSEEVCVNAGEVLKGWSPDNISQWKQMFEGKKVNKGDMLMQAKGWQGKKITAPEGGVIVALDEFSQIHLKGENEETRMVSAPVESKIYKIEKEKIGLSFEAVEVTGEATSKGKCWGNGRLVILRDIANLKSNHNNKVVFLKGIDQVWLSKAEVVGVAGMVVISGDRIDWESYNFSMPVVQTKPQVWEELVSKLGSKTNLRIMINSNSGRILLVIVK